MNNLNPIIATFIAASNARDHAALTALFLPDGVVADESQTRRGHEQVLAWSEHTANEYGFVLEPLKVEENVVVCRVSGTFDGSPIELAFHFKLSGEKIESLTIADA